MSDVYNGSAFGVKECCDDDGDDDADDGGGGKDEEGFTTPTSRDRLNSVVIYTEEEIFLCEVA